MIETVWVSGLFVTKNTQQPVNGPVELIPSRFWVKDVEDGLYYATRYSAAITVDGKFRLPVTACHPREEDHGWSYMIRCPLGKWTIRPDGEDGSVIALRDLVPKRYA